MMNMQLLNRSGLAAIAAATALISTPALGQEAPPAASEVPIVADETLTIEPLPTPAPEAATEPLAPAASATPAAPATRPARPTRATAAPAARAPATAAPRNAAPIADAPVVPTPTDADLSPADPAMVAPVPEPIATTPVAPASESLINDDLVPIAGAAGLGILAFAGAGFVMRRRRRNDEEAMVEETMPEPVPPRPAPLTSTKPIAATAPIGASAFSWNSIPNDVAKPVDRIEAAKRGPTPDNPSLSLKKRLKRAAFFDQRDRAVAAGDAAPVSAMAGLPESMAAPMRGAAVAPKPNPRVVGKGLRTNSGETLQPA